MSLKTYENMFLSANLPMLAQVVLAVSQKCLGYGHHIYADRLYSSIPLVNAVESRLTCFVWTVDKCRRQLPSEVRARSFKLCRGDIKAWRDGNKLCVAWRDKGKPTSMISMAFDASTVIVQCRHGGPK